MTRLRTDAEKANRKTPVEREKHRLLVAAYRERFPDRHRADLREYHRRKMCADPPSRIESELCECCGKAQTTVRSGRRTNLCFDHDHTTKKFRGWLCTKCNTGIGKLGDDIEGIKKALAYLVRALELTQ